MHISQNGLNFVAGFEGGRSSDGLFHAYWDPWGKVWTIGFGQTKNVHQGMTWTLAQAEADLRRTMAEDGYEAAINGLGVQLNQNQFDALCSFVYNLGPGSMQWDVGRWTRAHEFGAAAAAMLEYVRAGGVVLPGLVRRRQAERALFLRPWVDPDPHHYARFDTENRHLLGRVFSEKDVVLEYDRDRKRWLKWPRRLKRLRQDCGALAARLEEVKHNQGGHWHGDQEWRHDQLVGRERGRRYV